MLDACLRDIRIMVQSNHFTVEEKEAILAQIEPLFSLATIDPATPVEESQFFNTGLEDSLSQIALVYGQNIHFDFNNYLRERDLQLSVFDMMANVDVNYLTSNDQRYVGVYTQGRCDQDIQNLLLRFDPCYCYCVRMGGQLGAGHFSTLYFERGRWRVFSSRTHSFDMTTDRGNLTQAARDAFVFEHGNWGSQGNELNISYLCIKPEHIAPIVNQINTFRTGG